MIVFVYSISLHALTITMHHVLLCLLVLGIATPLQAQPVFYQALYRPAGAHFLVYQSPHFDVIYERGYEQEALELAQVLERHLPPVAEMVGHSGRLRMPVVLRGYNDIANGFVTVRPFKQEIDAIRIKGHSITSRSRSWIETVGPHELVHALHADIPTGGGIGSLIRPFASDHARSINLGGPSGINEGIAVWYESSYQDGAGRLQNPDFIMKYRAAAAEGGWSLAQMLERTSYTRPFDRHYIGGAVYADDVAQRDEFESFRRARRSFYRIPFLGYGISMWWGNREAPYRTGARLRREGARTEQERLERDGPFDAPRTLWSDRGTTAVAPRWINESTIVVYGRGYALRPGFYQVDVNTGDRRLISHQSLAAEMPFRLNQDRTAIAFTRYKADLLPTGAAHAGVYELDLESQDVSAITTGSRVHTSDFLDAETFIALQNDGQYSKIVRVEADGEIKDLGLEGGFFRHVAVRPGTNEIAILANVSGNEGVLIADPNDVRASLRPLLFLEDFPIYDISWSDDGRFLVFSGAPGDVSNIFVYDLSEDTISQLTNVRFGALQGSFSPDNQHLAYIHYEHERHEVAVTPVTPHEITVTRIQPEGSFSERTHVGEIPSRTYRARRYLAPRLFSPIIVLDDDSFETGGVELGLGLGINVEGGDPLNRWAYGGQAYFRDDSFWGSAGVSYGGWSFVPVLRAFREPSTVLAQFQNGEVRRIGRERRGIGVSMSLPLTLESNVFTTRLGFGLNSSFEQERLFDRSGTLRSVNQRSSYRSVASVRPNAFLMYRVQANIRDLAPNTGTIVSATSRIDLWDEFDRPARTFVTTVRTYLPLLARINGSVQLDAGLLIQNSNIRTNLDTFVPRGYRNLYLDGGTFGRLGLEVIQPITFVDDGSVLVPFYLKAIYAFGAVEGLRAIDESGADVSSATAGLGMRVRVFHLTDLDLRWGITLRDDSRIRASWR